MIYALNLLFPLLGGVLSAWHGGQINGGDNKIVKNFLWALPAAVCGFIFLPFSWINFLSFLNMVKGTGHGRGFRLREPMEEGSEPEKIEYLILWLMPHIPLYWYKVLLMSLIGLSSVSGSVIVFAYHDPSAALWIAAGGLFKGINAMLFDKTTTTREYADGVAAYSAIDLALRIVAR